MLEIQTLYKTVNVIARFFFFFFFFFFFVKTDGWIKYALCAHRYHLFKVKTIIQLASTRVDSNNHNLVPDETSHIHTGLALKGNANLKGIVL